MKILALESSAKAASVAVSEDGKLLAQYYQASGLTHSRTLLVMAQDILKNLELTMADIDGIAAAAGPGSFTGIRIGVAAAKGLAWGAQLPLCGVSTLEAMAHLCPLDDVVICPVMDARRQQVYNALFSLQGSDLVRLCPDRAISLEELASEIKNDKKMYFLLGDGAELCYNYLQEISLSAILAPQHTRLQNAWGVCMAAAGKEFTDPGDVVPNYLRLSQAERERLARLSANITN